MSILGRIFSKTAAPDVQRVEPSLMAAETSGTAQPSPFLFDIGFGGSSGSRVKSLPPVTPRSAERHATVFACCNVIAGDLAKVPLAVYQRGKDGRAAQVHGHPASYLLNTESAPGVPAMTTRYALAYSFTLRGRAYAFAPHDGGGEIEMLEAVHPDFVSMLADGRRRFYDFQDGAGIMRRVASRAMVHLRYMAEDGWTGRSPIEVASESLGLALADQEAAARSATGTNVKAFAKMAAFYEDDETYQTNARRLRATLDNPEANGIPIIGAEDDIKQLSMSAADQQLLESRKFDREQIAAIYRVPPSKLQMLEHGVKANGQQQAIDYKTDCLLHWGGFVERQMALGILTESERRAGMFLRHEYDALMQATARERAEAASRAVGGPTWTPNEWREKVEGLPPITGGDILNPAPNMTRDDSSQSDKGEDE